MPSMIAVPKKRKKSFDAHSEKEESESLTLGSAEAREAWERLRLRRLDASSSDPPAVSHQTLRSAEAAVAVDLANDETDQLLDAAGQHGCNVNAQHLMERADEDTASANYLNGDGSDDGSAETGASSSSSSFRASDDSNLSSDDHSTSREIKEAWSAKRLSKHKRQRKAHATLKAAAPTIKGAMHCQKGAEFLKPPVQNGSASCQKSKQGECSSSLNVADSRSEDIAPSKELIKTKLSNIGHKRTGEGGEEVCHVSTDGHTLDLSCAPDQTLKSESGSSEKNTDDPRLRNCSVDLSSRTAEMEPSETAMFQGSRNVKSPNASKGRSTIDTSRRHSKTSLQFCSADVSGGVGASLFDKGTKIGQIELKTLQPALPTAALRFLRSNGITTAEGLLRVNSYALALCLYYSDGFRLACALTAWKIKRPLRVVASVQLAVKSVNLWKRVVRRRMEKVKLLKPPSGPSGVSDKKSPQKARPARAQTTIPLNTLLSSVESGYLLKCGISTANDLLDADLKPLLSKLSACVSRERVDGTGGDESPGYVKGFCEGLVYSWMLRVRDVLGVTTGDTLLQQGSASPSVDNDDICKRADQTVEKLNSIEKRQDDAGICSLRGQSFTEMKYSNQSSQQDNLTSQVQMDETDEVSTPTLQGEEKEEASHDDKNVVHEQSKLQTVDESETLDNSTLVQAMSTEEGFRKQHIEPGPNTDESDDLALEQNKCQTSKDDATQFFDSNLSPKMADEDMSKTRRNETPFRDAGAVSTLAYGEQKHQTMDISESHHDLSFGQSRQQQPDLYCDARNTLAHKPQEPDTTMTLAQLQQAFNQQTVNEGLEGHSMPNLPETNSLGSTALAFQNRPQGLQVRHHMQQNSWQLNMERMQQQRIIHQSLMGRLMPSGPGVLAPPHIGPQNGPQGPPLQLGPLPHMGPPLGPRGLPCQQPLHQLLMPPDQSGNGKLRIEEDAHVGPANSDAAALDLQNLSMQPQSPPHIDKPQYTPGGTCSTTFEPNVMNETQGSITEEHIPSRIVRDQKPGGMKTPLSYGDIKFMRSVGIFDDEKLLTAFDDTKWLSFQYDQYRSKLDLSDTPPAHVVIERWRSAAHKTLGKPYQSKELSSLTGSTNASVSAQQQTQAISSSSERPLMDSVDHLCKTTINQGTGLPQKEITCYDCSNDVLYEFVVMVRDSEVAPNAGKGAFLTYKGAKVLKEDRRKNLGNSCPAPTREPMEAVFESGSSVSVMLRGEGIHGDEDRMGKETGVGLWRQYAVEDDFVDAKDNVTFCSQDYGCGVVELERYAPVLPSDRKTDLVFGIKNFIFSFEPSSWRFDVREELNGHPQVVDFTDDTTGEPHEVARRHIAMYVNEVGHNPAFSENVLSLHNGRSVSYYIHLGTPIEKGDTFELLVDYKEGYEEMRERKGYGKANIHQGVKCDKDDCTRLQRNITERALIEECIRSYTEKDARMLLDFIGSKVVDGVVNATSKCVSVLAGEEFETEIPEVLVRQWIARRRMHWLSVRLLSQLRILWSRCGATTSVNGSSIGVDFDELLHGNFDTVVDETPSGMPLREGMLVYVNGWTNDARPPYTGLASIDAISATSTGNSLCTVSLGGHKKIEDIPEAVLTVPTERDIESAPGRLRAAWLKRREVDARPMKMRSMMRTIKKMQWDELLDEAISSLVDGPTSVTNVNSERIKLYEALHQEISEEVLFVLEREKRLLQPFDETKWCLLSMSVLRQLLRIVVSHMLSKEKRSPSHIEKLAQSLILIACEAAALIRSCASAWHGLVRTSPAYSNINMLLFSSPGGDAESRTVGSKSKPAQIMAVGGSLHGKLDGGAQCPVEALVNGTVKLNVEWYVVCQVLAVVHSLASVIDWTHEPGLQEAYSLEKLCSVLKVERSAMLFFLDPAIEGWTPLFGEVT